MSRYKFGEIAACSKEKRTPTPDDSRLYIGLEHLDTGDLTVHRWGSAVDITGEKLIMHKGDLLFGRRNTYLRRAAIAPHDGLFSAHGMILRPNNKIVDPSFFPFFIASDYFMDAAIRISVGSLSPTVNWSTLKELEFELPAINEQREYARLLWGYERVRQAYQALLSQMDELVKSQFVEMFGDPRFNPSGYRMAELSDVSEIISGITKGRKPKSSVLRSVPYLCTANVQNGYVDWTETKYIDATEEEIAQYHLSPDDVLMIEGGDPDKVGRGCLAGDTPRDCIYQNHVFRVRVNPKAIIPRYFALYILLPSTKEYFLNCAKQTTGIATINKKQLSSLMVVCPPIAMQADYVRFADQTDKSKYHDELEVAA